MAVVVDTRVEGDFTVLLVSGDVDVYSAPALREQMNAIIADGDVRLIVDLTGVPFMDSTGLGVLVGRLKTVRQVEGELRLVIVDDRLLRNLKITGLDTVFEIYPSIEQALSGS